MRSLLGELLGALLPSPFLLFGFPLPLPCLRRPRQQLFQGQQHGVDAEAGDRAARPRPGVGAGMRLAVLTFTSGPALKAAVDQALTEEAVELAHGHAPTHVCAPA
jgi:hypothetical protein